MEGVRTGMTHMIRSIVSLGCDDVVLSVWTSLKVSILRLLLVVTPCVGITYNALGEIIGWISHS